MKYTTKNGYRIKSDMTTYQCHSCVDRNLSGSRIKLGMMVLLTGLVTIANAANIAQLPQTGQTNTLPVNPAPAGSDGALPQGKAWPTTRFVADASGNCITDQLTGLMWVKDLNTVNSGSVLNWGTALTTANNGTWCGYTDWRMPNINELLSLVNYAYDSQDNWLMYGSGNSSSPACSGACFANLQFTSYWSSSSLAMDITQAWIVRVDGGTGVIQKENPSYNNYRLFPVRGGQ